MELKDIRVKNANYFAERHGRKGLAEILGYSDENYLNQIVKGHGAFGNKVARRFEEKLGLPIGWMDQIHPAEWGMADDPGIYRQMVSRMTPSQVKLIMAACVERLTDD